MNIYDIMLFTCLLFFSYIIWQHNNVSIIARKIVSKHCKTAGVQLLDQNIILKKMRICRSAHSLFALQRLYIFEFSSMGDYRYKGSVVFVGKRMKEIELAPFKNI
jgi:hypothetical protein